MSDEANPYILDRAGVRSEANQLKAQLNLVEQVVNYGTLLIPRAWVSSTKQVSDSILIFHLLRKVILHLDSVHIDLSNGACMGAMPALRAMLEASMLIDWLLKADTENKANFLFVAAWRREKAAAEMFIAGTAAHQMLVQDMGIEKIAGQETAAKNKAAAIQKMEQHTVFGAIYKLFDQIAVSKGREPAWADVYETHRRIATGKSPRSFKHIPTLQIRTLFEEAGRLRDYRRIYGHLSEEGHGSALLSSLELDGGTQFQIPNIRDWDKFLQIFRLSVTFGMRSYRSILERYRPGEAAENFPRKYATEWKEVFLRPVQLNKTPEVKKI